MLNCTEFAFCDLILFVIYTLHLYDCSDLLFVMYMFEYLHNLPQFYTLVELR